MCHSALRIPYLRRFRIPHGIRTFVLSYLRTPLMREAFQLASLLAGVPCTSARPWR